MTLKYSKMINFSVICLIGYDTEDRRLEPILLTRFDFNSTMDK